MKVAVNGTDPEKFGEPDVKVLVPFLRRRGARTYARSWTRAEMAHKTPKVIVNLFLW